MTCKLLHPLAWLYGGITSLRNTLYDKEIMRSSGFDIPVINVGNLSAGGNGKTPMVEYLAALLSPDYKVAILSRGYGRKTKGFREVTPELSVAVCGDEPLQVKRKFGNAVRVFVGEDRVEAITKILFDHPDTQLIILDDAFQHRAVKAGLNLLLTSYDRLFTRDMLLPAGRLRESRAGAARADAIIVSKCPDSLSQKEKEQIKAELSHFGKPVFFSRLKYGEIQPVVNTTKSVNKSYIMVTAIAKPAIMENHATASFTLLDKLRFADHHDFSERDIKKVEEKISIFAAQNPEVLTSSKDAVRFMDFYGKRRKFYFGLNVLPVALDFIDKDKQMFKELIEDYVRKSSTNG